jgi:predicted transcriptional regulator of viral defense system
MKQNLRDILDAWQHSFIRDEDLSNLLHKSDHARYSVIKRALKVGILLRIRRGLYLIGHKIKQKLPDEFELALLIYSPSIISLESALSYHGWIPEVVYTTTCTTPKRTKEFKTPIGIFSYKKIPETGFYVGVKRIATQTGIILMAEPWRALADFMYTRHKSWKNCGELEADLRIDQSTLTSTDRQLLITLSESYPSTRVCKGLKRILQEITKVRKFS